MDKKLLPINRDNAPRFADLLIPKRGRHLDPVIVIDLSPGDKTMVVKDQSLVERDPKWTDGNKVLDTSPDHGCIRMSFRDAGKDFYVDAKRREENIAKMVAWMRNRGWCVPDSWCQ